ncbi:hypothetical protein B7463_g12155, partial [Scytalidium lignicola]
MSLKTFHLDLLRLSCSQGSIQLSVSSSVTLRALSEALVTATPQLNVADLASRNVWVSRGSGCRIDIRISIAGKPLNREQHVNILEQLGHHLLEAPLWSQLNLPVKLEFPALGKLLSDESDILIHIGHGMAFASGNGSDPIGHSDLQPPRDILCVEFEMLCLKLNFEPIPKLQQPPLKKQKLGIPSIMDHPTSMVEDHLQMFENTVACQLSEHGLRTLISGSRRIVQGFTLKSPPLTSTLSSIAPSIWSPGFSDSMGQNSRFLPIISRSVSRSWVKNVQSPSLQRKLVQLATSSRSLTERDMCDLNAELAEGLAAAIEARLWSMMQHRLYDSAAARRLKSTPPTENEVAIDDGLFEDLLNSSGTMMEYNNLGDGMAEHPEDFMKEESLYGDEDLLFEDQCAQNEQEGDPWDEDLGNFEEMERTLIEQETDDMLFEESWTTDRGVRARTMASAPPAEVTNGDKRPRYIDIGINLTDPVFHGNYHGTQRHPDDISGVIQRAKEAGCQKLMVTGSDLAESERAVELSKAHPQIIYNTIGVHPCCCLQFGKHKSGPESYLSSLKELALTAKQDGHCVAFGEIGLDYDRLMLCPKEEQLEFFAKQLDLAIEIGLPLFLHSRAAHADFVRLLKERLDKLPKRGVVHSFTGTEEEMLELVELGFDIGINGCSMKTAENVAVVKKIPLERIQLETDGPWCEIRATHASMEYLKDGPEVPWKSVKKEKWIEGAMIKGRNEPCMIGRVAWAVAGMKGINVEELTEAAWENTIRMFGLGEN